MKKVFILLVTLLFLVACSSTSSKDEVADNVVRVGISMPKTGAVAMYATHLPVVMEILDEDFKDSEIQFEWVTEDDQSDKNQVISVYEKLIKQDDVLFINGPSTGTLALAAKPVATDFKTPVFLTGVGTADVTDGNYLFRNAPTSKTLVEAVAIAAKEKLGVEKVAFLYDKADALAIGEYEGYKEAFTNLGVEIVADQSYLTQDIDFKSQLTSIENSAPDALVIAGQSQEAISIVQQIEQMGLDVHLLGGNAFVTSDMVTQAGPAMEGALAVTSYWPDNPSKGNQQFVERFTEKTGGVKPDWVYAMFYEGMTMMHQLIIDEEIKAAGDIDAQREKLKEALANNKSYTGSVVGEYTFIEEGNAKVQGTVIQANNGVWELFE